MTNKLELVQTDAHALSTMYQPPRAKRRSLGGAIILAAIADYRSTDEQEHTSAKKFLYPSTRRWQEQYDWTLALADGMNPAWLREALDRFQDKWDRQRNKRMERETLRASKSCLKFDGRKKPDEKLRNQQDGAVVPTERTGSPDPSFQPAGKACGTGAGDAAPGL